MAIIAAAAAIPAYGFAAIDAFDLIAAAPIAAYAPIATIAPIAAAPIYGSALLF